MTFENSRRVVWAFFPLALFAALALLFWRGLESDPSRLPSTLLGRQAPDFELPGIEGMQVPGLSSTDLSSGRVSIVNIFASWCVPCRDEHPVLMELMKRPDVQVLGINTKDSPQDAIRFLDSFGNPYARIGADRNGRVSIDWGGYGVPETFVVNGAGTVTFKLVGPMTMTDITSGALAKAIESSKGP